ncbi:MAG: hypothetical protein FWD73_10765 [Polyangiaceae bacterium]|nr:hypothetical protein [Polyangiaceae bacterium]
MKITVRTLHELGDEVVLAPERHLTASRLGGGILLGELVTERRQTIDVLHQGVLVIDTTHAKNGVLDVQAARLAQADNRETAYATGAVTSRRKKLAFNGDVVVSRLRPYLRQIALFHPAAFGPGKKETMKSRQIESGLALSTEFYVLAPAGDGEDIAYLLPFLLSSEIQSFLADAQEGGHHPRVPRESLLALRVPHALVEARQETNAKVRSALARYYEGAHALQCALCM